MLKRLRIGICTAACRLWPIALEERYPLCLESFELRDMYGREELDGCLLGICGWRRWASILEYYGNVLQIALRKKGKPRTLDAGLETMWSFHVLTCQPCTGPNSAAHWPMHLIADKIETHMDSRSVFVPSGSFCLGTI